MRNSKDYSQKLKQAHQDKLEFLLELARTHVVVIQILLILLQQIKLLEPFLESRELATEERDKYFMIYLPSGNNLNHGYKREEQYTDLSR